MSSIYRHERTGVYYIQWREAGRSRRRSLDVRDRDVAERLQADHDRQLELGLIDPRQRPIDLPGALSRWLVSKRNQITASSMAEYAKIARILLASGLPRNVADWMREAVAAYVDERATSVGPKTINNELQVARGLVEWLVEREELRADPVGRWRRLKARATKPERIGAYSAAEIERLIEHGRAPTGCNGKCWDDWLTVMAYTGCRVGELATMRACDVLLDIGMVAIRNKKGERNPATAYRHVELHPRAREMLARLCAGKAHDDLLFADGRRPASLNAWLEKACRAHGIQYRRIHGLRHAWISRLLRAGAPLVVVMRMAGHVDIQTTMRYLHVDDHQSGWVSRLDGIERRCPHCGGVV
jgi:integrase